MTKIRIQSRMLNERYIDMPELVGSVMSRK